LWGNLHNNGLDEVELSAPEYVDLQNQCQSFENLAAYTGQGFNLSGVGDPERPSLVRGLQQIFFPHWERTPR
jgi:hypothetical protein